MDPSDTASGSEETEARRYLHRFLRGLSELDAALGRWRPDYGRLPAAPAPDQHPPSRAEVVEAHRLYADGLRFFADHPRAVRRLERSVAVRVRYWNEADEVERIEARGAFSELLQHEIDHLDGILAVDRALDRESFCTREEYLRRYRAAVA